MGDLDDAARVGAVRESVLRELTDLFADLSGHLDERQRRLVMGAEARRLGRGGIALVARAAQVDRKTVARGMEELARPSEDRSRARAPGAGRPRATVVDDGLESALGELLGPRGADGPTAPLRWTTLSVRQLADALTANGHRVSTWTVRRMLTDAGFRLAPGQRTVDGWSPAARDRQFSYLNAQATEFLDGGDPVVGLRAYQVVTPPAAGSAERPRRPSGPSAARAAADPTPSAPYQPLGGADGVRMPIGRDEGTAALAVQTLRRWWTLVGLSSYPGARRLLLSPDGGGAKGHPSPWLASALARFAADAEVPITVCHLPAGTSRWSHIEHWAWDQFAVDLHGRRTATYQITLDVIGRSARGADETDRRSKPLVVRHELNGGWNYTVAPQ